LTAEKFMPSPFGTEPGNRLYGTGDVVRYRSNGDLEYLGRIDQQVKLRGYRIELGEIEAQMMNIAGVREAAVKVEGEAGGQRQLVGYIVEREGAEVSGREVREGLRERLPEYMIPAVIVKLEELPKTLNGKIDRKRLPAPQNRREGQEREYVKPSSVAEEVIAGIWSEVLGIEEVGVEDNFFDLGGHSLLALRVMARIKSLFEYELPLATLFEGPTIAALSSIIKQRNIRPPSRLVSIRREGTKTPMFFIHPIGGAVLCYAPLSRRLGPDQPFYGIQALADEEPIDNLEQIAALYIEVIKRAQPEGPYVLGGWSFGGLLAFEMAQQLSRNRDKVKAVAILDSNSPGSFDPLDEDDPLAIIAPLAGLLRINKPLEIDEKQFRSLDQEAQLLHIANLAKKENIISQETPLARVQLAINNFKAKAKAAQSYVARQYPGRLAFFKSSEMFPEHQEMLKTDPTWGWSKYSSNPVEVFMVPGAHEDMVSEPQVQVLAQKLAAWIDGIETE
jgi:thioesterase domain-containing protein/acyl carrier protein